MEIIQRIKAITEAAKRQGIVITDITSEGKVVSDTPAFTRVYSLREFEAGEDEGNTEPTLDIDDEEQKTDYDTRGAAAAGFIDSLINGDFEGASKALGDYAKLYKSEEGDGDHDADDEAEDEADMNGEASGTDHDYMMKVGEEGEEGKGKVLDEDGNIASFLGSQKQGSDLRQQMGDQNDLADEDDDESDRGAQGGEGY